MTSREGERGEIGEKQRQFVHLVFLWRSSEKWSSSWKMCVSGKGLFFKCENPQHVHMLMGSVQWLSKQGMLVVQERNGNDIGNDKGEELTSAPRSMGSPFTVTAQIQVDGEIGVCRHLLLIGSP